MTPRLDPRSVARLLILLTALAMLATVTGLAARGPDGAASGARQPRDRRIHLGVLRADGILLPFASFDGDDWRTSWPTDLMARELPASVASIPRDWWRGSEPGEWRVVSSDDQQSSPLKVLTPAMIRIGTSRRLALRTDRTPVPVQVPPFHVPFPKLGLAISGEMELRSLPPVSRLAPAAHQLLQTLRSALNDAEERTVSALRANVGWKHPFDKDFRTRLEPALETWYTTPVADNGARVSYVEIVKRYPPQPKDEGCGLETIITGWVHQSDKPGRPKTELRAKVMYCDRDQASYMVPFGYTTIGDRTYWIFQMVGLDHEWYVVAEMGRSRVRFEAEYFGGGIPAPRPPR